MNGSHSNQSWSELLCCVKCKEVFYKTALPVSLTCHHLMCEKCVNLEGVVCPLDKTEVAKSSKLHYVNGPVASIVLKQKDLKESMKSSGEEKSEPEDAFESIQEHFYRFATYLYKVESEKGATISSVRVSRTVQRKLLSILCTNTLTEEGRTRQMQILRSMLERVLSELILHIQNNSNLSSSLWNAIRARGCQFLGPAMQEDVLKIIYIAMCKGESLARKTLVLLIVQKLAPEYVNISKTCVGHVVQLLYRASCFNVIRREGQSSFMQLKEQFRDYEALRAEHDAQIVQIAMEAGLRISQDQWSSLLYGDSKHRTHMQSICDKLSDNSLQRALDELRKLVGQQPPERDLFGIDTIFEHFQKFIDDALGSGVFDMEKLETQFARINSILPVYSQFLQRRHTERIQQRQLQLHQHSSEGHQAKGRGHHFGQGGHGIPPAALPCAYPPPLSLSMQHFPGRDQRPRMAYSRETSPPGMGFDYRPMPLLPISSQVQQQSHLANYLAESSSPVPLCSPPPNFIIPANLPLSISPPNFQVCGRDSGMGPSQNDSLETFQPRLVTFLPLSPVQQVATTMPPPSHALFGNQQPSIILLGNCATAPECTTMATSTFVAPGQTTNGGGPIFPASPPGFNAGTLISTPALIPVQPSQSNGQLPLFVCGSTPPNSNAAFQFGSPPLLFPQWVTPLDTATISTGFGQNLLANATFGQFWGANLAQLSEIEQSDTANRGPPPQQQLQLTPKPSAGEQQPQE